VTRRLAAALLCAAAIAGCGEDDRSTSSAAPPRAGDAFLIRFYDHQQRGLALAKAGRREARTAPVRRIAAAMVRDRKRLLGELSDRRATASADGELADLGVSAREAAEDVGPDDLEGVRPFDRSFLALMARHDEGAIALARAGARAAEDPGLRALAGRARAASSRELGEISRTLARISRG
jgi:uncharacterized protein (DUF305 family)